MQYVCLCVWIALGCSILFESAFKITLIGGRQMIGRGRLPKRPKTPCPYGFSSPVVSQPRKGLGITPRVTLRGGRIPLIVEGPVQSLGQLYRADLSDKQPNSQNQLVFPARKIHGLVPSVYLKKTLHVATVWCHHNISPETLRKGQWLLENGSVSPAASPMQHSLAAWFCHHVSQ